VVAWRLDFGGKCNISPSEMHGKSVTPHKEHRFQQTTNVLVDEIHLTTFDQHRKWFTSPTELSFFEGPTIGNGHMCMLTVSR